MGGKRQLLKEILPLLPQEIDTYYEPFVGGGAVFFALASEGRFKRAVLNDYNPELINCYRVVRDNFTKLTTDLNLLRANPLWNTAEFYYGMRAGKPECEIARAARFIYLNRLGFNGLYRVNKKGDFNVPFGKYKNPRLYDPQGLAEASAALQGVEMLSGDFEAATARAKPGDAVYFDPPYVPVSKTSNFTSYSGAFGEEEQIRLARHFRDLQTAGVCVTLSNSDTPLVRELYHDMTMVNVQARRSVNSKASGRGKVGEVIVLGESAQFIAL